MVNVEPASVASSRARATTGFRETLPLLIASAALFAAGAACWWTDVQVGPPRFPLWALLVVLGFVASIGAVLVGFLGGGETAVVPPRMVEPVGEGGAPGVEPELGRPAPDVRRPSHPPVGSSLAPAPWDEGPPNASRPVPEGSSISRLWTDADAELAIQELDGIQQEIAPRRQRPERGG